MAMVLVTSETATEKNYDRIHISYTCSVACVDNSRFETVNEYLPIRVEYFGEQIGYADFVRQYNRSTNNVAQTPPPYRGHYAQYSCE